MRDEQIPLTKTDPEREKWTQSANRARQAWNLVWLRLRSITPARLVRIVLVLAAFVGIIWLFWGTWPALLPFLIGGVVAYSLLPLTNWLDRFMPRAFAVTIALLTLLIIFGLILYASVTVLGRQAFFLYQTLPEPTEVDGLIAQVEQSLKALPISMRQTIIQVLTQLSVLVLSNIESYNERAPDLIVTGLLRLPNIAGFVLGFLAVPAWLLLVLRDQQAGARALQRLLPASWLPDALAVWRIVDRSFRAFVQGLLVLALFVTLFVYIGLLLLDKVGALSVTFKLGAALFAGVMQLIPTVGPIIVVLVILLTRVTLFNTAEVLWLLGLYLVVEQLLRLTAEPRVRKQIISGIHPALLIMVIVALSKFGFLWVLLAAPVTAVIYDLFLYVYGRFAEPPRPAGLLPGESLPKRKLRRSPQSATPHVPAAYRHGRAARKSNRQTTTD